MNGPVEILYFYRTAWGAHDEFVALFRKNHWPILRDQLEAGRFLDVRMATPRFHGASGTRRASTSVACAKAGEQSASKKIGRASCRERV